MKEKDVLFTELEQWDFPDFQCKLIKKEIEKVTSEEVNEATAYTCFNKEGIKILEAVIKNDGTRPDLKIINAQRA